MGAKEMKEPLYVCVYVPEFPAQTLVRLRPELARKPVAVLAGDPPFEEICSLNTQANRLGIEQGMTRTELDSFSGLHILGRSEAEERIAKAALLEAAGTFTPRVELHPSLSSSFVMVLDMTGTNRILGSPCEVARSLAQAFKTLHFHVQLATSANLHTAVCFAPSACGAHKFIPVGREAECLSSLPLSALNLTSRQHDIFSLWGLHTLGELATIPEVELIARLGQEGKRLRLLARGELPHLMVPEESAFTLQEFIAFDTPIELLDSLLFVLGPMIDQLLVRANSRAYALAVVTVRLGLDDGSEHQRIVKPALPVVQRNVLLKLLHLDLQAHPPPSGILSIFIHAEPGDRSRVQLGLFAPQLPEPLQLDVTLARIRSLVGETRVGCARLRDTHSSESFTMEKFVVSDANPDISARPRAITALRCCRPPAAIVVQHEGQRPTSFRFHGKRYAVKKAYGPWRKSGEWWSSNVWSREEWDVCASVDAEDVMLCILAHDLLRQQWHMKAFYD